MPLIKFTGNYDDLWPGIVSLWLQKSCFLPPQGTMVASVTTRIMWPRGLATSNYGGLRLQESVFVWPRGHRWQACVCWSTTGITNQLEIKSFVVRQMEFWTAKGCMSSLSALKGSSSFCVAFRPHTLLLDSINVLNPPIFHCFSNPVVLT